MKKSENCFLRYKDRFSSSPFDQSQFAYFVLIGCLLLSCVLAEGILRTQLQISLSQAIPVWNTHLGIGQGDIPMWKSIFLGLAGCALISSGAMAQSCSGATWTPLTNGNVADASQVMNNFNCVLSSPAFSGGVGIGMSPSNILDITQNQNSSSKASILNSANLGSANSQWRADNGTHVALLAQLSESYSTSGVLGAGVGLLQTTGDTAVFSGGAIEFAINGNTAEVARFDASGRLDVDQPNPTGYQNGAVNIGIGGFSEGLSTYTSSTAANTALLFVNGNGQVGSVVTSGSSTAYNTVSDKRLKSDRGVIGVAPELIKLRVHSFVWKASKQSDVGLFAQEAYKVLPAIVKMGGADPRKQPWEVNYPGLIPRLLVGWQNHEYRIDVLEKQSRAQSGLVSGSRTRDRFDTKLVAAFNALKAANDNQAAELQDLKTRMSALEGKIRERTAQR
jgi:hypothetical protein